MDLLKVRVKISPALAAARAVIQDIAAHLARTTVQSPFAASAKKLAPVRNALAQDTPGSCAAAVRAGHEREHKRHKLHNLILPPPDADATGPICRIAAEVAQTPIQEGPATRHYCGVWSQIPYNVTGDSAS
jgi:hypothetical protein